MVRIDVRDPRNADAQHLGLLDWIAGFMLVGSTVQPM